MSIKMKKHMTKHMTKKHKKSHMSKKTKNSHHKKHISKNKKHMSKNMNKKYKKNNNHRGGFNASCNLATVKEPAFSVSGMGDIPGINVPESRGIIYRPNCQTDTNQAMIP